MKFTIIVECDNPFIDMAVENAAQMLRNEVKSGGGGTVQVIQEETV